MMRLLLVPWLLLACCSGQGDGRDADADVPVDPVAEDGAEPDAAEDPEPGDVGAEDVEAEEGPGPPAFLTVNETNPRYLDDGTGRAVLLVGASHGWELQDDAWENDYALDYTGFLDYLVSHNLNYVRMWRVESAKQTATDARLSTPMPYERTGPGSAHDGQPRFDLDRFDETYFDRLRARCIEARDRGIAVSVMFFERHSSYSAAGAAYPWMGHPFHASNNVNAVDGDVDGDGQGREIFLLPSEGGSAVVLALQDAYVRKVIDSLNDLENVIYEICNEAQPFSSHWQVRMLRFAREYMDTLPNQQLLGFTGPGRTDDGTWPDFEIQLASSADFVSPRDNTLYRNNPPANDGRKVIFADSDHIDPYGRDEVWVWKSFTRGLHPQVLEAYDAIAPDPPRIDPARDERVRTAMGQCLEYAGRMDLVHMVPSNDLASSTYCLADPGSEILVFVPGGGAVDVDLSAATAALRVEWLDVGAGAVHEGGTASPGGVRTLTPPFDGHAVLYLRE